MANRKLTVPRPRLVKGKGDIWHVSYTDPVRGFTRKRSTGTRDRREAERMMPAIMVRILSKDPPTKPYKLAELFDAYENTRGKERKDATHYALTPLRGYFSGFLVSQLNDRAWSSYRAWRTSQHVVNAVFKGKGRPVSDATACKELNVLRAILTWARRNGWPGLTDVKVHLPGEPQNAHFDYLTRAEFRRLYDACVEPHQRLFVLVALATGARMSAILELTWDRIHWPAGKDGPIAKDDLVGVNVRPCPIQEVDFDLEMNEPLRIDLGRGRGNKRRGTGAVSRENIPLYEELLAAHALRETEYVIEYRGKRVGKVDLSDAYRRAGLTRCRRRQHILKHTCCSWLVQSGASFEAVGKLVGTRAQIIERHYGHLSPAHLATIGKALTLA